VQDVSSDRSGSSRRSQSLAWGDWVGLAAAVIATIGLCLTVSFAFTEPAPAITTVTAVFTAAALGVEIYCLRRLT
jgi:hypothetical protein